MNKEKIQQIEDEIKNLHYNPTIKNHSFSDEETKNFSSSFWDVHVKAVIEYSKQMAEKYKADLEAVWLAAILHDICRLTEEEPHDALGSERAYKMLLEKGFEEQLAQKVKDIVLTHRCKKYPPESIEQKIVASADAMAHFLPPFYLWMSKYSNKGFTEIIETSMAKIERDFNQKIFFEDERRMVEKNYEVLKGWFEYKI